MVVLLQLVLGIRNKVTKFYMHNIVFILHYI